MHLSVARGGEEGAVDWLGLGLEVQGREIISNICANAGFPTAKMPVPYGFSGKLDRLCRVTNIGRGTPLPSHPVALLV